MKNPMKFSRRLLLIAAITVGFVACDDNDDGVTQRKSAFQTIADSPDHNSLEAALIRAGLDDDLSANTQITVFAPDDDAFDAFLTANSYANLNAVPLDVLTNTLLNHVVAGVGTSNSITTNYVKTLATNGTSGQNIDMFINTSGGVLINNTSSVTTPDIFTSNGVLHVVSGVIALPTVATLAAANPNFSVLVTAVTQEGLVPALANTSTTAAVPAPYTVFAPTNAAFTSLIAELPSLNSTADVLALGNLDTILLYHVVAGSAVRAAAITNGQVVTPAAGGTFSISTTSGVSITDGNNRNIQVSGTDVTAINGVIHVVDRVLLPQ